MKKYLLVLILVFNILFSNICYAQFDLPVWSERISNCTTEVDNTDILLTSKAGVLIDMNNGNVLYEFNSNQQLRPASVTKIMTILLIKEEIKKGNIALDDIVECSENAMNMGGSQIWLDPKDKLTVDEMLKAICVVSANDCCVAMAEHIAGSTEKFVEMMNNKANELGMKNTTFKNCHGLDEDGHLTTAQDIAIMSRELMINYPEITNYTTIWMDTLRDGKSQLVSTNKLLKSYKGITGLKTGSTSLALYNISATATRDNLSLIAVTMGAPTSNDRFNDAKRLLDFGFANYKYEVLCKKGEAFGEVEIIKGKLDKVQAIGEEEKSILINKKESGEIAKEIKILDKIVAPVSKGKKLGEVIYYINNKEIARNNIIAYYNVEKMSITDYYSDVLEYVRLLTRVD